MMGNKVHGQRPIMIKLYMYFQKCSNEGILFLLFHKCFWSPLIDYAFTPEISHAIPSHSLPSSARCYVYQHQLALYVLDSPAMTPSSVFSFLKRPFTYSTSHLWNSFLLHVSLVSPIIWCCMNISLCLSSHLTEIWFISKYLAHLNKATKNSNTSFQPKWGIYICAFGIRYLRVKS